MIRRCAVVALVLLTACAGSPNQRPKVKAHATTTVASTTSTTPISTSTTGATTNTTASELTRACSAQDLVVASIGDNGASGHTLNSVQLKNVSTSPCALSGYPTALTGHTRDGVALSGVHNGAYQPDPKPGTVQPGSSGVVIIDSYGRCTDDYPGQPIRTYVDIHIGLPGGGDVSLGDFAVGPTCLVGVSQLGVNQ